VVIVAVEIAVVASGETCHKYWGAIIWVTNIGECKIWGKYIFRQHSQMHKNSSILKNL